ncbi:MAG TPA: lysophospholipid acyltransferase family protein [Dissulfurispiraceae bacterium]|nr:lysophospholipid acyltransferase family protein [Dissulfurispiraceae bacterium]
MPGIIKILRLFLLVILNLVFLVCGILIRAVFFVSAEKKMRVCAHVMQWWARTNCFILGIHITPSGAYKQNDVFFIVSNHCSYLDVLIIGAIMPSVFVSKNEVASWIFLGRIVKLAGTVFIDRESKTAAVRALKAIKDRLESGISVVVFPEGTTDDGLTIRDFKSTFFKAPIDSKVPVLPLSIMYSHIDWRPVTPGTIDAVAWHSDMQFVPHFWNLLGFSRIDARIHFNPPLYHFTEDRKTLSSFVFGKVKQGHSLLRLELKS